MTKNTSVKLKEGFGDRLKALGQFRQRSTNWLLNDAVERYLEREEARAAMLLEMQQAHEEYERGGRLHLTQEEVEEWMSRKRLDRDAPMPPLHK
jgi:predicted transcriptional regulator